jgi:hypothetical protein
LVASFFTSPGVVEQWRQAAHGEPCATAYQLGGASLRRLLRGYDPASLLLEALKRKDFFGVAELPEQAVLRPDSLEEDAHRCPLAAPFMCFLCDAAPIIRTNLTEYC